MKPAPFFNISIRLSGACLYALALAALVFASGLPAQASPGELYVRCSSDPEATVVYFSEIFLASPDTSTSRMRGVSFRTIEHAYLTFLQQKYSFKSGSNYPTACSNAMNNPEGLRYAQTNKQQLEDQYRQAKKQVIETGWKYAADSDTAPAPASATEPTTRTRH